MKIRNLTIKLIKYLPFSAMRVFAMKHLLGYSIGKNVIIGKSIVNCKKVIIGDNVYIAGSNNIICDTFEIGANSSIHSSNTILGKGNFSVGTNSRIINNHYFDLWNNIYIGNNSWIAGRGSQFWTHGSMNTKNKSKDLSIIIEDDVYIGSSSLFAPGTRISSINLIGLGSVVSGVYDENSTIVSGNPAQVVKTNIDWRTNW